MSARASEEDGTATANRIGPGNKTAPHRWRVQLWSGDGLVMVTEVDAPNGAMAIVYASLAVWAADADVKP